MVFGFFTDAIENALGVVGDVMTGEVPTKRSVAKLIDAGLTVAAIATAFGVGEEIITALLKGDE
jgi:hypothetical protein